MGYILMFFGFLSKDGLTRDVQSLEGATIKSSFLADKLIFQKMSADNFTCQPPKQKRKLSLIHQIMNVIKWSKIILINPELYNYVLHSNRNLGRSLNWFTVSVPIATSETVRRLHFVFNSVSNSWVHIHYLTFNILLPIHFQNIFPTRNCLVDMRMAVQVGNTCNIEIWL